MSRMHVNDYISSLHQQISYSVEQIKSRSNSRTTITDDKNSEKAYDYGYSRLNNYAYNLLSASVSYQLSDYTSWDELKPTASYAASSYSQADNINREPTVLLDFMFKNNREFDFKI